MAADISIQDYANYTSTLEVMTVKLDQNTEAINNLAKSLSNGAFKNVVDAIKESNGQAVYAFNQYVEHQKELAAIEEKRQDKMCEKIEKMYIWNRIIAAMFSILTAGLLLQSFGVIK